MARKPLERNFKEFYAGEFYSNVDLKNRIFLPAALEKTLVSKNQRSNIEELTTIILYPKKDRIECYDSEFYYTNKEKIDHKKIYVARLDLQRRLLISSEVDSVYSISKKVSIHASKNGSYFIIKNKENKK